ncbi:hypothetical protein GCM10029964_051720 [Kibdelosporangium lantanae]
MTVLDPQVGSDIQPFTVQVPEDALEDLRRRLAATRLPSQEIVGDRTQGVQLATMRAVHRYWSTEYDSGRVAARLNALPQFTTEIDGVGIHFVHVRSRHEDALPLIMTHGWPGSVIEMIDSVGPLTDRTVATPPTRSTSSCRRCPGTDSRPSRVRSGGISYERRVPGRS